MFDDQGIFNLNYCYYDLAITKLALNQWLVRAYSSFSTVAGPVATKVACSQVVTALCPSSNWHSSTKSIDTMHI